MADACIRPWIVERAVARLRVDAEADGYAVAFAGGRRAPTTAHPFHVEWERGWRRGALARRARAAAGFAVPDPSLIACARLREPDEDTVHAVRRRNASLRTA